KIIVEIKTNIGNKELAWLFENCFPNTLDTTVDFCVINGQPDTYVITGDIDAMWLRDSSAQVWPYLPFCKNDHALQQLIAGVINRQAICILRDPYANAFYKDEKKISPWHTDDTDIKPGIHERKWEVDSVCYPIRLAHGYWKATGDVNVFDEHWLQAMYLVIRTFKEQQRFDGHGPYSFQRKTSNPSDSLPMDGYGYPVNPNGLICSAFRPSDDATLFSYNIPANFFALTSLKQRQEILAALNKEPIPGLEKLIDDIATALKNNAIVRHEQFGEVYAYEINGFGSYNLMDDANIPSLLSLSYLIPEMESDEIYLRTRNYVLSNSNPFFYSGTSAEGIGGPHVGENMIWPMSIIMRGLTSRNNAEIKSCLKMLRTTHAGTGFMHESFNKDNPAKYTRSWFAWANTLFGGFILKTYRERPHLLDA
ncbi:MAG: glycoside hydrolase family 125 protein, partial [Flavipsychrobacter sp.]